MTKELQPWARNEDYNALIEEIKATISETRFGAEMLLLEGRHKVGEAISRCDTYKKHKKGNRGILEAIAGDAGMSQRDVYYCVQFYEKFPVFARVVQETPGAKTLTWTKIRALLPASEECKHTKVQKEILTITRKKCTSCGKITEEKKQKQC